MKTFLPKPEQIDRKWWVVDADGKVLGHLAVRIADVLRGKHKPTFATHLDCGDFVVVVNAEKVKLTGRKEKQKLYKDWSTYMGGLKVQRAEEVRAKRPERIVQEAVWGMMPKGRLGRAQYRKLKVYKGATHPHEAQQAEPLPL
ncbi:MAG: 50S ribosomal protein L13 [Lentisphaerae bacterium RIFOXYB12_FULL_65_16]|nr:MAG: 50S ribosomal protein L13 [Lentisphaerae bacterium RIFOXYA12_64_32]OGV93267.1 MAG: 50S ribosomal protein L13 [Lentisphaerae bacterium RIFOXYB12_FULL_65_16]